ncbi:hypothetical protein MMC09_005894 [Bachmanniomyces sp. S44760]|nr:hypothetical protein [Bachmanniomyces sp. S44760]
MFFILLLRLLLSSVFLPLSLAAATSISSPCPLLSTPTYNLTSAVFTACTNISIASPASEIVAILLDFANYHRWNTFVIDATLVSSPSDAPQSITTTQMNFDGVEIGSVYNFTTQGLVPSSQPNEPGGGGGGGGGALTYSQELITVLPTTHHRQLRPTQNPQEKTLILTLAWSAYHGPVLAEHVSVVTEHGQWINKPNPIPNNKEKEAEEEEGESSQWQRTPHSTSIYSSWETYYGPAAIDVFEEVGAALQKEFVVQGVDLKGWAESGKGREGKKEEGSG